MKHAWSFVVTLALLAFAGDVFEVTVTRQSQNLYRVHGTYPKILIETKLCYEYAYSEDAILKYSPRAYDNELIFIDSKERCDVKAVYTEAR